MCLLAGSSGARAQAAASVPWRTGESLEYAVKLAGLPAGTALMQVFGQDTIRGRPTWRLHFNIKGSAPLGTYHVDDSDDSWMDVESLSSLHFEQHQLQGGKATIRIYDIFPDRRVFHQLGREEKPSVANPLDEASLFYFVRTLPLVVGKEYRLDNYFDPDANPVIIRVLRKDTVNVPAGRFPAVVIEPVIKTKGLFSKDGHAEIWLSDDERKLLVQMKTRFSIISLGLYLTKIGPR